MVVEVYDDGCKEFFGLEWVVGWFWVLWLGYCVYCVLVFVEGGFLFFREVGVV